MSLAQPSARTMVLTIVVLAALTCTMFSLVCLGHDATVAALSVTAIVISAIGIILLTFFISEHKRPAQQNVVLNTVRPTHEMTDRPPLPPWVFADPPPFVPPFPVPPPQIIGQDNTVIIPSPPSSPPTYEESAEIEDRRVTDNSNAPPAYNRTNFVSDNNIASFSPPPFYSPPSPFFGTSVQTSTMYLSSETIAPSPVPTIISPLPASVVVRAPSPVRRHPARRPRRSPRQPKPQETVIVIENDQASTSSSSTSVSSAPVPTPKSISRRALPQMFIDCSKAEPTLFTINGEESII